MKYKNKKIIKVVVTIAVVLAFMMPVSASVVANKYTESESIAVEIDDTSELSIGRVWLRGLLFRCTRVGDSNRAMALRLHYIKFTPFDRTSGMVTMNRIIFGDPADMGHMYEIGFGMFTYVFGFFKGRLEIL